MFTMYFCYDGKDPVIRCWPAVPRVGDTVGLAESGRCKLGLFEVTEVVGKAKMSRL